MTTPPTHPDLPTPEGLIALAKEAKRAEETTGIPLSLAVSAVNAYQTAAINLAPSLAERVLRYEEALKDIASFGQDPNWHSETKEPVYWTMKSIAEKALKGPKP